MSKLWSLLCFNNSKFNVRLLAFLWNFWFPFLGTGIRVLEIQPDFSMMYVKLAHRFWNINYLGYHYGGSIYSMCDPFYMVMWQRILGKECFVIDKAAKIEFLSPGKGDLFVRFELSKADIDEIRERLRIEKKFDWHRILSIEDNDGNKIAQVEKVLSLRRRHN
jgi:hypothetical protein